MSYSRSPGPFERSPSAEPPPQIPRALVPSLTTDPEELSSPYASAEPTAHLPCANGHIQCDTAPAAGAAARLHRAVNRLRRSWPEYSAAEPPWLWQIAGLLAVPAATIVGLIVAWQAALSALLAILALPFLCVVLLRAIALWHAATTPAKVQPAAVSIQHDVQSRVAPYTVLAPLFREANVVPDLVAALAAIDYPPEHLQIIFIVESIDHETWRALAVADLAAHMHVVVVPDGSPRTKPRALNFALTYATGDYVVVYDAEDVPEPDQLRRALARLRAAPRLGCVQARLNVYNADDTWITRQFAIEYTALFDCLLPALERLRLPVPLGGTSNHFPRRVLEQIGGWDPYNVTEDADLGIRLARRGWQVEVLASTTWEEAPAEPKAWLGQRRRWLKGWMQTYLVHMREPVRLLRELGLRPFLGLQVLMGGLLLSALVHPWFYVFAVLDVAFGLFTAATDSITDRIVWWLGLFNLFSGYITGVALGALAVARRGRRRLAAHALLMPVYWLMISYAAYRALWQLMTNPYYWEKTEHRARNAGASKAAD